MKRIAIVGSGNFGANAALFIAENNLGHVTLIDNKEGLAKGKALDLMEAAPERRFDVMVKGTEDLGAIAGADVVLFAAGVSPKAGQNPAELLEENYAILKSVLEQVKASAPEAIVIIQREPVAQLVAKAVKECGLDPKKVIGVTGLLESARFRYYVARELGIAPMDTTALVIGGAGAKMIPLVQFSNVSGIPLSEMMSEAQIAQVVKQSQDAEEEVNGLLKMMPGYYTPAAAIGELIGSIVRDRRRFLPVTVLAQGEYGLKDVAVALPAQIGPAGVEKILELELTAEQKSALAAAAK